MVCSFEFYHSYTAAMESVEEEALLVLVKVIILIKGVRNGELPFMPKVE